MVTLLKAFDIIVDQSVKIKDKILYGNSVCVGLFTQVRATNTLRLYHFAGTKVNIRKERKKKNAEKKKKGDRQELEKMVETKPIDFSIQISIPSTKLVLHSWMKNHLYEIDLNRKAADPLNAESFRIWLLEFRHAALLS
ncbi:hypothetical protein XELAEV_18034562mg [Xenopus laevis]|uniref:Uncharacterized protein n=1 Tax=Xenopus laevis TaxID=8355 RepID=A0A974HB87_XENLA|nr:hypothetical protein XELAEV_18034562mg [Xenopus laevis]